MNKNLLSLMFIVTAFTAAGQTSSKSKANRPNVIYIYADDLGYGDLSCYGATKIHTPNVDKIAAAGIRFTNGHCTSATCTPSRYALMTGEYPWRKKGTGILPGDAALIIPTDRTTLPNMFKKAGYKTGIVGKWHLGLGNAVAKDWNGEVKPGPNEVGFDYSFIFPATADRVPTVFLENHHIVALDPSDPIAVDYTQKIGNDPTGKEHSELLKLKSSPGQGHDGTIVNGIGRIGYMSGGKLARWVDEEVSSTFLAKAEGFIEENQKQPFFLYFTMTEPHVPRMPATRFKGKSGLGLRGDVILQLDWTVGEIMKQLKYLGLDKNTIIIFTSDNGPVLNDGYQDEAVAKLNGHTPAGPMRGGKYSALEGGTHIPFIVSWPGKIKPRVSGALVSQMDLLASFSAYFKQPIPAGDATDSENLMDAFLGKSDKGRSVYIEQGGALAIVKDGWKYITPNNGASYNNLVDIETGNSTEPQLYNLNNDIGEKYNLAAQYPEKVKELASLLKSIEQKK
ncbi:sulfatase family protein [Mucilaginibacter sp. FT3.2]|uniref:sulfatase family protein n=1 Tax=Mucilaginibacter sp. FT3.2 TaxID=2723090 RepID=UPI001623113E|nr:arylsulfatase [Mucilaginibacter sp. FT3.2]MBB6232917.1 arylsulfatase A-like enzyme [Mucilaginibacter sp. FT3.2]